MQLPGGEVWQDDPSGGLAGFLHPDDPVHGYRPLRSRPRPLSGHRPQVSLLPSSSNLFKGTVSQEKFGLNKKV